MVAPVWPTHTPNDVVLGILPFYHIYGTYLVPLCFLTASNFHLSGAAKLLHFPFQAGTPVVIMPRFNMDGFCSHIARYKVTIALVVPPMLLGIAKSPGTVNFLPPFLYLGRNPIINKTHQQTCFAATAQCDLRSLQVLFSGAAPLGSTLVNAVRARLQSVGANVHVAQGTLTSLCALLNYS